MAETVAATSPVSTVAVTAALAGAALPAETVRTTSTTTSSTAYAMNRFTSVAHDGRARERGDMNSSGQFRGDCVGER